MTSSDHAETAHDLAGLEVLPIAIGVYEHHPDLAVDDEVARVVGLLAEFGAREVPWQIAQDARDSTAIDERLQLWATPVMSCNAALYWVGHGWSDGLDVSLAHCRSPAAVRVYGISPDKLAEPVRARQATADGCWVIVIIDTCWSKQFVDRLSAALDVDGVMLVGVAGDGPTSLGRFSTVLECCLKESFRADRTIELWRLVAELDRRLPHGRVTGRRLARAAMVRQVIPIAGSLKVPLDVLRELEEILSRLSEDERRHFLVKAQGAEEGEISWFFEGRSSERRNVVDWLRTSDHGMLVVTGRAGSGKSALLGQVLVHSLPELRDALADTGLVQPLPADELPPDGVFDEVVHLTGTTVDDLVRRIAEAAGFGEPPSTIDRHPGRGTANDLDWLVGRLRACGGTFTLLVDALDEATDPFVVARSVLRRIASLPRVRVVVGTRASTSESPDYPVDDENLLEALGAGVDSATARIIRLSYDADSVARYVRRRLTVARDRGTLAVDAQPVHDDMIGRAAEAISRRQREFLFARLAVYEILADPTLLNPMRSLSFGRLLEGDHRNLFEAAVDRLAHRSDAFRPLLEALALARGRGLPIVDGVWALIATALVNAPPAAAVISDVDISSLLAAAQPYVAIDTDDGQTVYRLSHRTFAEFFIV